MKPFKLGLIASAAALILAACSSDSKDSNSKEGKDDREVVKVVTSTIPLPAFWNIDLEGKGTGYVADYIEILEDELPQYDFQYELGDGSAQLLGVETGKYDMAAYTWFKNEEREQKYLFTEPFGNSYTVLITKDDRDDIHSLEDVVGKSVVPMTPISGLRAPINKFNEQNKDKQIVVDNVDKYTIEQDLKWVAEGKYDVDFKNLTAFTEVNEKLNLDLKIASVVTREPVYFLFNKEKEQLAKDVEEVTKKLIEDGTLSELSNKWFGFDSFEEIEDVQSHFEQLNK